MSSTLSRRDAIKAAAMAAGAASLAIGSGASAGLAPSTPRAFTGEPRKRTLRVAHLTDIHIQPELRAAEGFASVLHHVQSQKDKPDLIITGGDLVMDSLAVDEARVKLQWDLFSKVLKGECSLPVEHTLGNHDIWGWNRTKSKLTGAEAGFGKQRALDQLALTRPYHSFDRAGWHFICLDSISPDPNNPDGYIARLDEEQFGWLEGDLALVKPGTPTMIVSPTNSRKESIRSSGMRMCFVASAFACRGVSWAGSGASAGAGSLVPVASRFVSSMSASTRGSSWVSLSPPFTRSTIILSSSVPTRR